MSFEEETNTKIAKFLNVLSVFQTKSSISFSPLSVDNSRGVVRLRGQRVDRNGVEYVSFNQLDVSIIIGKSKFQLDNLFNGDPVLSQVGNAFVNENSELFVSELIPGLEKSLSKSFLEIVNVIMKDVTFDELFPET